MSRRMNWAPRPPVRRTERRRAQGQVSVLHELENILGALFHLTKPYMAVALDQKESRWTRRQSTLLAGQTLGILGLGAIGQELARKASALGMRVIGSKREPEPIEK